MNSRGELQHFVYAALMALGLYLGFFYGCEYRRNVKGPWQVTFTTDTNGQPAIVIDQPALRIASVQIVFAGEPRPAVQTPQTVFFASPTNEAPFGKVIFRDTTFLPGTITFDLFGHEIELLPRVLGIDRREHAWQSETTILLPPKK